MPSKDFRFGISSSVQGVDLNQLLVDHPLSTYFMRVAEDIPELGLLAEDILVIDRSAKPKSNDLVVAVRPDDPELKIIRFDGIGSELELWGVAIHLIRKIKT